MELFYTYLRFYIKMTLNLKSYSGKRDVNSTASNGGCDRKEHLIDFSATYRHPEVERNQSSIVYMNLLILHKSRIEDFILPI